MAANKMFAFLGMAVVLLGMGVMKVYGSAPRTPSFAGTFGFRGSLQDVIKEEIYDVPPAKLLEALSSSDVLHAYFALHERKEGSKKGGKGKRGSAKSNEGMRRERSQELSVDIGGWEETLFEARQQHKEGMGLRGGGGSDSGRGPDLAAALSVASGGLFSRQQPQQQEPRMHRRLSQVVLPLSIPGLGSSTMNVEQVNFAESLSEGLKCYSSFAVSKADLLGGHIETSFVVKMEPRLTKPGSARKSSEEGSISGALSSTAVSVAVGASADEVNVFRGSDMIVNALRRALEKKLVKQVKKDIECLLQLALDKALEAEATLLQSPPPMPMGQLPPAGDVQNLKTKAWKLWKNIRRAGAGEEDAAGV